jgi:hypothetical protein
MGMFVTQTNFSMTIESLIYRCIISCLLFLGFQPIYGQFTWVKDNPYKQGDFFFYWGYNRDAYSTSDIRFHGENYDFTLENVIAKDRQSPFDPKLYFNPLKITIPQFNFRIGYMLYDHYQLSIGADHMKYVMQSDQSVKITGYIENSQTAYDGYYEDQDLILSKDFLLFEHTDGLNYGNVELRRFDVLFGRKQVAFAINEGLGVGVLIPRTNTTLLSNPRYDEFHLSGYGIAAVVAANLTLFKYFFIQSEWKGGFIHMPDIRTTMNPSDRASQHFLFSQYNVVFGFNFRIPGISSKVNR